MISEDDLKELAKDAQHIYVGKECRFAARVLLPFWKFKVDVWATEKGGPKDLDQIFFGLLQNGVNTRDKNR